MEKKREKSNKKKEKKELILGSVIIGCVLTAIIVFIVIFSLNGKEEDKKEQDNPLEGEIISTEETVTEEYGFSKEDAIDVVKGIFQSDNYEFDATVREDNMWVVTVTNTDNNNTYILIVNPNDGTHEFVTE